jgi:hypothetical protein
MNDYVKEVALYCTTAVVVLVILVGSILYGCKINNEFKLSAMQAGYIQTEQVNVRGLKWVKADNTNNVPIMYQ